MHYLNPEQLRGLLDAIDPRYKMFIAVLGIGGLRFGEATALRVGRCDLLRSRLMVVESLADVNGHFHFGDPKTHQKRAVTIPKFLRDELGAHIAGAESPSDLVFTAPEGGPIRYSGFYKRFWKPALEKADLPHMGLHALRHTCAALLIAEGAHPKAIQLHLGHQSITTTLDTYGHLFESEHEKLAERIDTAYAGVLGSSQPLQRPDEVTRTVQRLGELETRVPGLVVGGVGLR
jgi:integrase